MTLKTPLSFCLRALDGDCRPFFRPFPVEVNRDREIQRRLPDTGTGDGNAGDSNSGDTNTDTGNTDTGSGSGKKKPKGQGNGAVGPVLGAVVALVVMGMDV